nr:DUF2931 family protein [Stutzerimonas stutzeri]
MIRILGALLGILLLSGCQAVDPLSGERDPHSPWWSVGLAEPAYMTVWVETVEVEDIHGRLFRRVSGGTAPSANGTPEKEGELARGWSGAAGGGKSVVGADLPRRVFVRWQSIVEPQTYRAWVDIPEEARQIMHNSVTRRCPEYPGEPARYHASLNLGLAPGGIVQVWVMDNCYKSIKVARTQAEVEPLGPDQGNNEGRYAYKVSEKSRRYIERFGIPYGSW